MTAYAFIFARGGSKGLPRKNTKLLHGKPLVEYSIQTALQIDEIKKVFVSTEDKEIAEISAALGAIVINRPEYLATDTSKEWLSWQHAIEWVQAKVGYFDTFISLPATSPLRSIDDVEASLNKLKATGADMCISVTAANRSPYFNMVTQDALGFVNLVNRPIDEVSRRQDAPKVYDITTVVYATHPRFVLNSQGIFDGRVTAIEVPKERAVDIDDIYDFKLAEVILREKANA
jgi:CMP-N-acetylneuraminic acid synthetase